MTLVGTSKPAASRGARASRLTHVPSSKCSSSVLGGSSTGGESSVTRCTRLSKQTRRSHKHSLCPAAITWWTLTTTLRSVRAGLGRPTLSSSIHDGWRECGTTSLSYRGAGWEGGEPSGRASTRAVTLPACTSSASHARLGCDIDSLKKREGGPLASGGGVTERRERPTSRPNERGQTQGSEDSLRIGRAGRLSTRVSFCAARITCEKSRAPRRVAARAAHRDAVAASLAMVAHYPPYSRHHPTCNL
eukprot:scaffold127587_cov72-Phaeocystis_antarctica.AAC.6